MARIGVFGGSFNPIHEGHVSFLQQIKVKFDLDEILLVVCKDALHKHVNLVDKLQRFEMCRLATKHLNYVKVSNLEFEIDRQGRSVYTLKKIKQQNPESQLFLIVGFDSFLKISTWHRFEDILNLATIVSGYSNELELKQMKAVIQLNKFNALLTKVSVIKCHSTMIRIKLAQGLKCSSFLNVEVENYIKNKKLYCDENALVLECENVCKNMVSEKRFYHCLMVAQAAVNLAVIYGENEKFAQIAGLLHDVVKQQSNEKLLEIFNMEGIGFNDLSVVDRHNFKLWHAPAGAIYCRKVLGLEIKSILSAIACHTTGKAGMTKFEKIVYIADNVSADRKGAVVEAERELAYKNLDEALFFHLKTYFKISCENKVAVHLNSVNCFNDLIIRGIIN